MFITFDDAVEPHDILIRMRTNHESRPGPDVKARQKENKPQYENEPQYEQIVSSLLTEWSEVEKMAETVAGFGIVTFGDIKNALIQANLYAKEAKNGKQNAQVKLAATLEDIRRELDNLIRQVETTITASSEEIRADYVLRLKKIRKEFNAKLGALKVSQTGAKAA